MLLGGYKDGYENYLNLPGDKDVRSVFWSYWPRDSDLFTDSPNISETFKG